MRVLKKGRPQKGWSVETKCTGEGNGNGGCGALLLVEQIDLYCTASHHYDGSKEVFTTFQCSECGIATDLSDVPSGLTIRKSKPKQTK